MKRQSPKPSGRDAVASKPAVHTPLPWTLGDFGSIEARLDGESVQVALMSRTSWAGELSLRSRWLSDTLKSAEAADAALIVTAVNSHAALVQALEHAKRRLEVYAEWAHCEIIASRGSDLLRNIKSGCLDDANDIRATLAGQEE